VSTTLTRRTASSPLPGDDTPARFAQADTDSGLFIPAGEAGAYPPPPEAPEDPGLPGQPGTWFDVPARLAHHGDLRPHEVLRALPAGSRPAGSQLEALNEALARLSLARVRPEFREKLERFFRVHVLRASWGGPGHAPRGVSSPGRERVCRLAGLSVSAYKRCRRWWEAAGFLAIVRPGWTPAIHPGLGEHATRATRDKTQARLAEQGLDKNLSQAYLICVPRYPSKKAWYRRQGNAPHVSGPLTFFSNWISPLTDQGRENSAEDRASCCYPDAGGLGSTPGPARQDGTPWPGLLGQVTARTARRLTRPYKAAGWTDGDILWALDRKPDDTPHPGTGDRVRKPAAVAWWRLAHWRGPDGTLLPSPSQQAAEHASRTRAEQDQRRTEDTGRQARAASQVTAWGDTARAMLATASHGAAKVISTMAARRPAAPEPPPAPAGTADSVMAAILARRASRPQPDRPAESLPAGRSATPLPGYLQAAVDHAAAAVAAEESAGHDGQAAAAAEAEDAAAREPGSR
jgi:hypothetical protein